MQLSKLVLYVNEVTLPVTSSYTTHRLYGINRKPIHEIRVLEVWNKDLLYRTNQVYYSVIQEKEDSNNKEDIVFCNTYKLNNLKIPTYIFSTLPVIKLTPIQEYII